MFDKNELFKILNNKTISFIQLTRQMNIPRSKNRDFSTFLFSLVKKGKLFSTKDGDYFVPEIIKTEEGIIRLNSRGFGFVDQAKESIFIQKPNIHGAMDNDRVVLDVFQDPMKDGSLQGIVKDIVIRNRTKFVGLLQKFQGEFSILPDDMKIIGPFKFDDEKNLKIDYVAKVQIIEFGKVKRIKLLYLLGQKDDVSIDILSSIEDANVPFIFDPKTLMEAKNIPLDVSKKDIEGRKDLREELIVTIDGDDTKDFDDAIEVKKLDNGNFILSTHIADVTHYVTENTQLDKEAQRRGTSIYLADRVIPMLPEELSNGICSLNPHVDRLTLSCDMIIDKNGHTIDSKIYPSIINSRHRLTYNEVNDFYFGKSNFEDKKLENMLKNAKELSNILRQFKINQGYIDFEIEESKIIINEKGKTKDIIVKERAFAEIMIEDFMVRANETVAETIANKKLPFIYRIHDTPEADRLKGLQNVVDVLGIDVKIPTTKKPMDFARAVLKLKEHRFDDFIKVMMLRTMAKAIYSEKNIGHFGLASTSYTHFTSPIRRYPDLMVHRMLKAYLFDNKINQVKHFTDILPTIAADASNTEQKSVTLERHVADIKKAEFYENKIGQKFNAVIVSVMKFGFFIELHNKVAGLVHASNLMDGRYNLDKTNLKLVSGSKKFVVGQSVIAIVVGINKREGSIDFVLEEHYTSWKKSNGKNE
ncbi:ribonuclease R [Candidatus Mycoplasma mahonii]|uniref:ribonuclease R n=1 Tax=Candidatus Mycoplasma mahonii TaxID=3004105 RepID=UPI0026E9D0FD|nr:ribonuclease R [Candidatus Mycoplasma mahonii]WKX02509.1 ribonuclease R [Candidatus Mycoplasma mahonii]